MIKALYKNWSQQKDITFAIKSLEAEHLKIKKISRLNGRQREEIRELEAICHAVDKTKSKVYLASDQNVADIPCFFLAYINECLVGFLGIYLPTIEEAEIKAFVHPQQRQKGYFEKLFNRAKKVLTQIGVKRFIFVHEANSKAALPVLESLKAQLERSEYVLSYRRTDETGFSNPEELTLTELSEKTQDSTIKQEIFKLYRELFQMSEEEIKHHFEQILESIFEQEGKFYLIWKNDKILGCCAASFKEENTWLYDFGIDKEFQGQGHGKHMLELVVHELRSIPALLKCTQNLLLHVNGANKVAFSLYTGFGFEVVEQYNYYCVK